jgi:hypothetical protein
MTAKAIRQDRNTNDPAPEVHTGWDAQRVWRERVSQGPASAPSGTPAQGWDPYLVWLSRVKKA